MSLVTETFNNFILEGVSSINLGNTSRVLPSLEKVREFTQYIADSYDINRVDLWDSGFVYFNEIIPMSSDDGEPVQEMYLIYRSQFMIPLYTALDGGFNFVEHRPHVVDLVSGRVRFIGAAQDALKLTPLLSFADLASEQSDEHFHYSNLV